MELKINRRALSNGLALVQGVVERRTTMPVLTHVLLEAEDKVMTLKATDMELGLSWKSSAEIKKPGKAVVPARGFFDIVRELSGDDVNLSLKGNGWMEITSGKSSFKVVGLKPDEFPPLPKREEGKTFKLNAGALSNMIDMTAFAMSNDEARYQLNGAFWEVAGDSLRFAATDGHRLSVMESKTIGKADFKGVIIPRKGMLELKKLAEKTESDIEMWVGDKYAAAEVEGTTLIMRLVDGKFPPYDQVVPKEIKRSFFVNREELHSALKRMSTLSVDKSLGVKLNLTSNVLMLTAINPDFGEGREELAVEYKGENFEIGFNARYLTDAVAAVSDEKVEVQLGDEVAPAVIRTKSNGNFTHVIMPMRL